MTGKLIYLDTSNIIHLTDARTQDPAAYELARSAWRAANVTLALSRVHLVELRAHDMAETRAERVRTIQDLAPVRTDIAVHSQIRTRPLSMSEREILLAVLRTNCLSLSGTELVSWTARLPVGSMEAFPLEWLTAPAVNALRSYDDEQFGAFTKLVRAGVEATVTAIARPAGTPYDQLRITDLSDTIPSPADIAAMEGRFAVALADINKLPPVVAHLPNGAQRDMLHEEVVALREFERRVAAVGLRQAFAEQYGVGDVLQDRRTLDQVLREWTFRRTVQQVLRDVLTIDSTRAEDLSKRVQLEACPGIWLYQAVDLEIKKNEPATAAGSAYDLDHLVYYPYVHEFFADKRIRHHVRAALRRSDCPPALKGGHTPRTVPRSAAALATEFGTFGT